MTLPTKRGVLVVLNVGTADDTWLREQIRGTVEAQRQLPPPVSAGHRGDLRRSGSRHGSDVYAEIREAQALRRRLEPWCGVLPMKPEYAPLVKPTGDCCTYVEHFEQLVFPPPLAEIRDHTGLTWPIFDATVAGTAKFAHAEHAPCYLTIKESKRAHYITKIHIVPTSHEIIMDDCYRCGGTAVREAATATMPERFACRRCAAIMFLQPHYSFPWPRI